MATKEQLWGLVRGVLDSEPGQRIMAGQAEEGDKDWFTSYIFYAIQDAMDLERRACVAVAEDEAQQIRRIPGDEVEHLSHDGIASRIARRIKWRNRNK